jgi:hypothetical protein
MGGRRILAGMIFAAVFLPGIALAEEEEEPSAIIELGGAGEWGVRHGEAAYGPNLAAETTPIPDWLEIEAGVTPFFSKGQTEWDTDFLFKKPYTLSDTVEFMFGVGPEWAHSVSHGATSDSFGGEAALDFMFWPVGRRIGFYVEPSYGYDFGAGHDQTLSVSAGLLIAIP